MIKSIYYWCWRNLNPMDYYRSVKWFLQRLFRGHSDCDIWNMNNRLSEIIHSHLVTFKKMKRMGVPVGASNTHALDIDNNDNHFNIASMIWEYKLDAMIEAFRIIKDDDYYIEEDYPFGLFEGEKIWHGNSVEYKLPTWKEKLNRKHYEKEKVKTDIQNKKVKEGMELFVKHFQDLWD